MNDETTGPGEPHGRESFSQWFHTWRYLFYLLGLVGIAVLFYAEENWRAERAWRLYKEQREKLGESFEPASFIPPLVPDSENFAATPALAPLFALMRHPQAYAGPRGQGFYQVLGRYDAAEKLARHKGEDLNSWVRGPTDLPLWAAALAVGTNHNVRELLPASHSGSRPTAAAAILEALSDSAPELEELRQASQRPHSRFNIYYQEENPAAILLPHLAPIKQYCRILQLRTSAELGLRQADQALDDLRLMLYLTDASRQEPILISQLVRMAEFQLALQPLAEGLTQWSEPQLRALQQRLQEFDFCADMKHALEAERTLFGLGMIEWVRRAPNKLKALDGMEQVGTGEGEELWPVGALMSVAPDGWLALEELNLGRAFDRYLLPTVDLTNRVIRPELVHKNQSALDQLTESKPASQFLHHRFFAGLLLPRLTRVAEKVAFTQTAVDLAGIACALERYRRVHGRFPDALPQLSPEFIQKLPSDIINAQPLKYRLRSDGNYVLYSVGWNQTDDGGQPHRNKSGETDARQGDWVWSQVLE